MKIAVLGSRNAGLTIAYEFKEIPAQNSLDYRSFHDDISCSMVYLVDLKAFTGVKVPVMRAVARLVSVVMERDYLKEGKRTLKMMGLVDFSREKIDLLRKA